jgi:hypothetical protein
MPDQAELPQSFATTYWPKGLNPTKTAFIGAYIDTCSISEACAVANVQRHVHYYWLATDAIYLSAWLAAKPLVAERLEDEAVRRGFKGVLKPVTIAGQREEITEYDSGLLKMLLMAHAPDRFKQRVEQTNFEKLSLDDMTPEMMDKLANHMLKQALGDNPAVIAEVDRRLAAGESPTFEEAKAIEGPKE